MKEKLRAYEIAGPIITLIYGTLLHFVFNWSGQNVFVSVLAPVNESVWEHVKLLFWPYLTFAVVEYFAVGAKYSGFIFAKAVGAVLGSIFIIGVFYTYSGALGRHILWVDITIFILSVILAYIKSYRLTLSGRYGEAAWQAAGTVILLVMAAIFAVFSIATPGLPLFGG